MNKMNNYCKNTAAQMHRKQTAELHNVMR